jgi:sulfite reductase alpha subunit-like flavoprotein
MAFISVSINKCMNKTKSLTDEQFRIQLQGKRDVGLTDWWLKQNGLNPDAISTVCIEVLEAQRDLHELLKNHSGLLTPEQMKLVDNFKQRLKDKKKRKRLRPSSAYPIRNLCKKIKRLAYRHELEARKRIQTLRNQ